MAVLFFGNVAARERAADIYIVGVCCDLASVCIIFRQYVFYLGDPRSEHAASISVRYELWRQANTVDASRVKSWAIYITPLDATWTRCDQSPVTLATDDH